MFTKFNDSRSNSDGLNNFQVNVINTSTREKSLAASVAMICLLTSDGCQCLIYAHFSSCFVLEVSIYIFRSYVFVE